MSVEIPTRFAEFLSAFEALSTERPDEANFTVRYQCPICDYAYVTTRWGMERDEPARTWLQSNLGRHLLTHFVWAWSVHARKLNEANLDLRKEVARLAELTRLYEAELDAAGVEPPTTDLPGGKGAWLDESDG